MQQAPGQAARFVVAGEHFLISFLDQSGEASKTDIHSNSATDMCTMGETQCSERREQLVEVGRYHKLF
eukprot:263214-Hanusia_phi.AAC.3